MNETLRAIILFTLWLVLLLCLSDDVIPDISKPDMTQSGDNIGHPLWP